MNPILKFFLDGVGIIPAGITALMAIFFYKHALFVLILPLVTVVIMLALLFASSGFLSFFTKNVITGVKSNGGQSPLYDIVGFFGNPKEMSKCKLMLVAMTIIIIDAVAILIPVVLFLM